MFVEDNTHPPVRTGRILVSSEYQLFSPRRTSSESCVVEFKWECNGKNPTRRGRQKTVKTNCPRELAGSLKLSFQTPTNSSRAKKGDPYKAISREFDGYLNSESMLQATDPDELSGFTGSARAVNPIDDASDIWSWTILLSKRQ